MLLSLLTIPLAVLIIFSGPFIGIYIALKVLYHEYEWTLKTVSRLGGNYLGILILGSLLYGLLGPHIFDFLYTLFDSFNDGVIHLLYFGLMSFTLIFIPATWRTKIVLTDLFGRTSWARAISVSGITFIASMLTPLLFLILQFFLFF